LADGEGAPRYRAKMNSPIPPGAPLGAVLAGGQSARFGSDKALAVLHGRTLLDSAVARLAGWCGAVVVIGRADAPVETVADWPAPGMGPLAGLAAALRHARDHGFAEVMTMGVDSLGLPDDLPFLLAPGPAYLADQPVVGLWPAGGADVAEAILNGSGRHSMRALAEALGARAVALASPSVNVNFPDDLAPLRG
jgi:molybdopterin-guanine dinucleotide biosynthesis protein A